jgi:hypothetical protein
MRSPALRGTWQVKLANQQMLQREAFTADVLVSEARRAARPSRLPGSRTARPVDGVNTGTRSSSTMPDTRKKRDPPPVWTVGLEHAPKVRDNRYNFRNGNVT